MNLIPKLTGGFIIQARGVGDVPEHYLAPFFEIIRALSFIDGIEITNMAGLP